MTAITLLKPRKGGLTDRQRLLKTFVSIITDGNNRVFTNKELRDIIEKDFDVKFSTKEIDEYFEPNFEEVKQDLTIQMRNLGVSYE
jgi:hypothetical protein